MTILEAMARGMPVVAPGVGDVAEIIDDGVDGFPVPDLDPRTFAERCLRLRDAGLRRRTGQAARARIGRCFSANHMAGQYRQLYHESAG